MTGPRARIAEPYRCKRIARVLAEFSDLETPVQGGGAGEDVGPILVPS
ncbi:MAG: hypothetical protein IH974_02585 [Myxococcales bacterium]|nr:hypothetical protein [Myxococcales bacterium]